MHLRADSVGGRARALLLAAEAPRVLAAFARSIYLRAPAGEIACIGCAGIGEGPLNVPCATPPGLQWSELEIAPGMLARADGAVLSVGRARIDWGRAPAWLPPAVDPTALAAHLEQGLARIDALAREAAPDAGLAPLLAETAGRAPSGPRALLDTARPGIGALASWRAPRRGAGEAVCALLGLGPGLTPSGDDALAGALLTLHALGARHAAARLAGALAPVLAHGTSPISAAFLEAAAAGEGAAALHAVLAAIAGGERADIDGALAALTALGHSSGWDALLGLRSAAAGFLQSPVGKAG